MSFGTVLQNLAIPSHQRQFVRPSRGDEDAIRRVARRHAREGGGCDQHRWRHVGQYGRQEVRRNRSNQISGLASSESFAFADRVAISHAVIGETTSRDRIPCASLNSRAAGSRNGSPPRNPDYSAGIK